MVLTMALISVRLEVNLLILVSDLLAFSLPSLVAPCFVDFVGITRRSLRAFNRLDFRIHGPLDRPGRHPTRL